MLKMKTLQIAIVILIVSVSNIGTTDHICTLDADSWILPEEGFWHFKSNAKQWIFEKYFLDFFIA